MPYKVRHIDTNAVSAKRIIFDFFLDDNDDNTTLTRTHKQKENKSRQMFSLIKFISLDLFTPVTSCLTPYRLKIKEVKSETSLIIINHSKHVKNRMWITITITGHKQKKQQQHSLETVLQNKKGIKKKNSNWNFF